MLSDRHSSDRRSFSAFHLSSAFLFCPPFKWGNLPNELPRDVPNSQADEQAADMLSASVKLRKPESSPHVVSISDYMRVRLFLAHV
jgi:hypothetical protein